MERKLKYTHPAKTHYSLNKLYTLSELQKELSMNMIKILFTPIGWDWDDLNPKKKSRSKPSIEDQGR